MIRDLLIAGGGIAGMATALAAARAGWWARVYEQAPVFSEVGAGLQLGPNATRVLRGWGLLDAVRERACAPGRLVARDARTGAELASLPLGADFEGRYGAPYLTVHRADLHEVLLQTVRAAGLPLHAGQRIEAIERGECVGGEAVRLRLAAAAASPDATAAALSPRAATADAAAPAFPEGEALAGCDGLWSVVREAVVGDGPARPSDHVAYRGLVRLADLPPRWREHEVTAWLGPRLHVVTYPVRGGDMLNVVCVVQQQVAGDCSGWDLPGTAQRLQAALGPVGGRLQEMLSAVPAWGLWVLHDRDPVAGAAQLARGRVALLGDAAHPMRPYLAQGAAMAIEDAQALGAALRAVSDRVLETPEALQRYALGRWQRVAHVQRRSLRNGTIFHAAGPLRLARDLALRGLGARLMDVPWLYG